MKRQLIEIEKKGIAAFNQGDFKSAVKHFSKICNEHPDFEHGMCFYHLACAYEELGDIDNAKKNFKIAVEYAPEDYIRIGGYASFLYLHDENRKAFDMYLKLITIENNENRIEDVKNSIIALKELGKRIGLSTNDVMQKIDS